MSWHRQYRGRSLGRILHFLYYYCGYDVSQMATVGDGQVHYQGSKIATYEFLSDTDIPFFTFIAPQRSYYRDANEMKEMWEKNQKEKMVEAIREADDTKPEPCRECQSLKIQLSIYKS